MPNDLHLIQYRNPWSGARASTVLCPTHRIPLMAKLRAQIIGCSGAPAPVLSVCDECE